MSILDEAKEIVYGKRRNDYGTPLQNHSMTAEFWNTYLARISRPLNARDICNMNILQKIARDSHTPIRDNPRDYAGYADNMGEIEEELTSASH